MRSILGGWRGRCAGRLAADSGTCGKGSAILTSGYQMNIEKIVNGALFSVKYDQMVYRERH